MVFSHLICPVCGTPLSEDGRRLLCEQRHSFDLAKSGYCNLLPPSGKHVHGDNKEMIRARRDFLECGAYSFLADAVADAVRAVFPENGFLLDAGCGECYYTEKILAAITEKAPEALGIDISKDACIYGKKRLPSLPLAAASLYRIPVESASVDTLVLLFAPFAAEEISRVLKPNGHLVMAFPGRRHLFGLKEILYETPYENEVAPLSIAGYTLVHHESLSRTVCFKDRSEIESLFMMTPYYYRTRPADKEKLYALPLLETELSFELAVYRKD